MHSRVRRRVLAGALVGGGFAGGLLVGGRGLLRRQAAVARAAIGKPLGEQALTSDRTWKEKHGDRVELLLLGDSIAAGLGAEQPKHTLGARLAKSLAKRSRRAVRLHTAAVVGSESKDLAAQLATLPATYRPDVAVVVVGGNDVTHRVPVAESVAYLEKCVRALQERGAEVVVGTCPDLGTLRPVPQPLRALGSRASRQLATAQAALAVRLGVRAVPLAREVGPFFVIDPEAHFSVDRFHPSSLGYKRTAQALLPHLVAALAQRDVPTGPTTVSAPRPMFALAEGEC